MRRIYEDVKMDIGLVSQALNNTNKTGRYHSVKNAHRILALLNGGAMAATKTTILELLQATDLDGSDAKGIPSTVGQEATATITANALVTECTVTLATFLVGGTITINGLVFTAHVDTTTKSKREFSISGNDTADAGELVSCINDGTYGVPGITASNDAGVVTLVATTPGGAAITVASSPDDGTCVKATTKAQAYVEIGTDRLDFANGFLFVAPKVTTTANSVIGVEILKGQLRYNPTQKVGAAAVY